MSHVFFTCSLLCSSKWYAYLLIMYNAISAHEFGAYLDCCCIKRIGLDLPVQDASPPLHSSLMTLVMFCQLG